MKTYGYSKKRILGFFAAAALCALAVEVVFIAAISRFSGPLLTAAMGLGLAAVFAAPIRTLLKARNFTLTLDSDGISVENGIMSAGFRLPWADVGAISAFKGLLVLETTGGKAAYVRDFFEDALPVYRDVALTARAANPQIQVAEKTLDYLKIEGEG